MKDQIRNPAFILIFLLAGLNSCIAIKSVNNFSETSLNGIKKFGDINYSFQQHCNDRCLSELIKEKLIMRETDCECDIYRKADNITRQIYYSIETYLSGLATLSGSKLTDYDFKPLEAALSEGAIGEIKIEKEHAEAYSRISEILTEAATDIYRRNKIKRYVEEANEPLRILLEKFHFIIQKNLPGELNYRKEELFGYYQDLMTDNSVGEYEKNRAALDYYQQLSEINIKQRQMDTFARSLERISEGHQKLYDNRNRLTAKDLKILLTGYAKEIRSLISEFNKLK
jgi:hypothetical protein